MALVIGLGLWLWPIKNYNMRHFVSCSAKIMILPTFTTK